MYHHKVLVSIRGICVLHPWVALASFFTNVVLESFHSNCPMSKFIDSEFSADHCVLDDG